MTGEPTERLAGKGVLVGQGRAAEVYAWGEGRILKLFRDGRAAAHLEREVMVTRAVHEAGLPVPDVEAVVEVDGRPGIVYERVDGPTMLQAAPSRPWQLARWARVLAELHVAMHGCVVPGLPSQREQMRQSIEAAAILSREMRQAALEALAELPDGSALCHGDFHPDNVLVSSRGSFIIDWDSATQGCPVGDLARTSLMIRTGHPMPGTRARWLIECSRAAFHFLYMRRYLRLRPTDRRELAAWELPVAAARLGVCFPAERQALLALVRKAVRHRTKALPQ